MNMANILDNNTTNTVENIGKYVHYGILIVLLLSLSIFMTIPSSAMIGVHNNITGNLTDPKCANCHIEQIVESTTDSMIQTVYDAANATRDKKLKNEKLKEEIKIKMKNIECVNCHKDQIAKSKKNRSTIDAFKYIFSSVQSSDVAIANNYTAILTVGQNPYQLGPFFMDRYYSYTGWSWQDADDFGKEEQKNLVTLTILDNSTDGVMPVTGLVTRSVWPQASYRKYSGDYSYKADSDHPYITTQNNYPDNFEILMVKDVDLTNVDNASLTFRTWFSIETDWDYGYVAVSTDGNSWTNIQGTSTTNANPYGGNLGNGITGSSTGWVLETMDLSPFVGNKITIAWKFVSDAYVNEEGWYIDDINVTSDSTVIFSDDAEAFQEIKTLSVNITYPDLGANVVNPMTNDIALQYSQGVQQVDLQESANHPGTYIGYFKYIPFGSRYSGDYAIMLDTVINDTPVTTELQFQTTIFGCQNCHNKKDSGVETSYIHGEYGGGGMVSCTYICHSGSRGFYKWGGDSGLPFFGPPINANPMHVHEMQYGHSGGFLDGYTYPQPAYNTPAHVANVTCEQCHTSFIHDDVGIDTAEIASYTLYGKDVKFSSGIHSGEACEDCHGTLNYPTIPQDQYQLQGILGDYNPTFTSSVSFTDTYVVAVNGTQNLSITVIGDDTSNVASLYIVGPVDNTTTGLQGPCNGNPCEKAQSLSNPINIDIANPYTGTWLVKLIQLYEGTINYTIVSSYPIEEKPIINIPDCKDCHNLEGMGDAYTEYELPSWNPGFAHVDIDNSGNLDIQCRTCHNAMHDIEVKKCQDCHSIAPNNHIVTDPEFGQYTLDKCLKCHGDPHDVSIDNMNVSDCIICHGTSSIGNTYVNTTVFDISIHQNIDNNTPDTVNNDDCWRCHYNKNMNVTSIKTCKDCHVKPQQWHGNANITSNLTELS